MSFRKKPGGMDIASFNEYHTEFLEYICKTELNRIIGDIYQSPDIKPICVFKEPIFSTEGAHFQGEVHNGEDIVSLDIVVVYPHKNWHMLFMELKSCPNKGKLFYLIEKTETEFHLLYDYMLNHSECIYALFEDHVIPGEKNKVPREVIESCYIDFFGIYRRRHGDVGKILSSNLPPLPELLKNHDKYPLVFSYV